MFLQKQPWTGAAHSRMRAGGGGGTGGRRRAVRALASGGTRRGTRCAPPRGCVHGRQAVPLYVRTVHAAGALAALARPGRRRWCRAAERRLAGRGVAAGTVGGGGDSRVSGGVRVARWWATRWQGGGRRHQWTAAGGWQRATGISKRVGVGGAIPRAPCTEPGQRMVWARGGARWAPRRARVAVIVHGGCGGTRSARWRDTRLAADNQRNETVTMVFHNNLW